MSDTFSNKRDLENKEKIRSLIQDFPSYIHDFFLKNPAKPMSTTLLTYAYDIRDFLYFEKKALPGSMCHSIKDIPVSVFENLRPKDIDEYSDYLSSQAQDSRTTAENYTIRRIDSDDTKQTTAKIPLTKNIVRRRLASLSSLLSWLRYDEQISNDPMKDSHLPRFDNSGKILTLTGPQAKELLDGILQNDKIVVRKHDNVENPEGEDFVVREMTSEERKKHDRFIDRDYAIIILLLGTGIRVSELVGIDVNDVDLTSSCIHVLRKGGRDDYVYFGKDVSDALSMYLGGQSKPAKIMNKYERSNEIYGYIKGHTYSPTLLDQLCKRFYDPDVNTEKEFRKDMQTLWWTVRRGGRKAFNPKDNALFLSNRGKRIAVRTVEKIVKDAVIAYVPDCVDAVHFSPHKLRSTAAGRVLRQTGDIAYAQQMLGHSTPSTTSRFYARLTKDDMKRKAAEDSLTEY